MQSKHNYLVYWIPILAVIGIVFISGCTSEQIKITGSGCPYEGATYGGLVSGSGELIRYSDGEEVKTPYVITYNLEMTFKCGEVATCPDNPNQRCQFLSVTHAKVSDPFFECTNGCAPTIGSSNWLSAPMPGESGGHLELGFPNGAGFSIRPLIVDPDMKTIRVDQIDHEKVLISILGINGNSLTNIEDATFNCDIKPELSENCYSEQQGFTMTLNKIS